jgi:hypothetical protein
MSGNFTLCLRFCWNRIGTDDMFCEHLSENFNIIKNEEFTDEIMTVRLSLIWCMKENGAWSAPVEMNRPPFSPQIGGNAFLKNVGILTHFQNWHDVTHENFRNYLTNHVTKFKERCPYWQAQPLKNFLKFYGNWRLSTVFITHPCLGIPSGLLLSGFPTNNLHVFLFSLVRPTCSAHPFSSTWSF